MVYHATWQLHPATKQLDKTYQLNIKNPHTYVEFGDFCLFLLFGFIIGFIFVFSCGLLDRLHQLCDRLEPSVRPQLNPGGSFESLFLYGSTVFLDIVMIMAENQSFLLIGVTLPSGCSQAVFTVNNFNECNTGRRAFVPLHHLQLSEKTAFNSSVFISQNGCEGLLSSELIAIPCNSINYLILTRTIYYVRVQLRQ